MRVVVWKILKIHTKCWMNANECREKAANSSPTVVLLVGV